MKDPTLGMSKDFRKLARQARKQRWEIVKTSGNHFKWIPPDGGDYVVSSNSASDMRAVKGLRASLRKHGLKI